MEFHFASMNEERAHAIADWHYEGPYAFYDMSADPEDLEDLLTPGNWNEIYHAVVDERDDLVGLFSCNLDGDTLDIGVGLRPDLTGHGLGGPFMHACLAFARERFGGKLRRFRLIVLLTNERAIKLYRKVGFRSVRILENETNGSVYDFLEMVRDENPTGTI